MQAWLQIVGSVGTMLVGAFAAWWARGKTRADAASTVTDAALKLISPQTERIARLEEAVAEYQQRVGALERRERESIAALSTHAEWDAALVVLAAQANISVPPMPPLFPFGGQGFSARTRATDHPE